MTLARQGNERENSIVSSQTSAVTRFRPAGCGHAATIGLDFASEEQFAPALIGIGTRAPASIYDPDPYDPVTGFAPERGLAYTRGRTSTAGVYAFDTVDLGNRWQVNAGLRWEYYDATYKAEDAVGVVTTDLSTNDGLFSGKAGLLYQLTSAANVYLSFGSTVTPPGTANFTLSASPTIRTTRTWIRRSRATTRSAARSASTEQTDAHLRRVPHRQRERDLYS